MSDDSVVENCTFAEIEVGQSASLSGTGRLSYRAILMVE